MFAGTGQPLDHDNRWFYAQDGQRQGPVPLAALHELVAAGRLRPADLVWRAGMDQWEPASAVTLLWSAPGAAAAPVDAIAPAPAAVPSPAPGAPHPMPMAAPAPLGYGVAHDAGVAYASWGQRFGAWVIDWLILSVVRFVVMVAFGTVGAAIERRSGELSEGDSALLGLIIIAVMYLCAWPYYALMEASRRRGTLGKLAVGIEVGDAEGGPASFVQTSVRFFLRLVSAAIFGIGFLMPLFTARRQALHDVAANTIVTVKPRAAPPGYPAWQHQQQYAGQATHPR
jgi:uncharacterized RDD family membrane protein YckC